MSAPVTITKRETRYVLIMREAPMVDALRDVDERGTDDLAKLQRYLATVRGSAYRIVQVETQHTLTPLDTLDAPQRDEGGAEDA